jgi:hypothetical protein
VRCRMSGFDRNPLRRQKVRMRSLGFKCRADDDDHSRALAGLDSGPSTLILNN